MMRDIQVAIGDICGDPTGLRVKVEDVDMYDYVHFRSSKPANSRRMRRKPEKCPMWLSFIASRS